jgi:transcriptional regulator with XRE-family HTH domain
VPSRRSKSKFGRPAWLLKIETLRRSRQLNQSEFGAQLGLSAMAVSRWERGVAQPPGEVYIRLGNLAGYPLCWFFWEQAGLQLSDVTWVLPAVRRRWSGAEISSLNVAHAGSHKTHALKLKTANLVAIPLLAVHADASGRGGDKVDLAGVPPESMLAAPWNGVRIQIRPCVCG